MIVDPKLTRDVGDEDSEDGVVGEFWGDSGLIVDEVSGVRPWLVGAGLADVDGPFAFHS